jgi:hypothetical protein
MTLGPDSASWAPENVSTVKEQIKPMEARTQVLKLLLLDL